MFSIVAALVATPALAASEKATALPSDSAAATARAPAKTAHEPARRRLSKFEARKIRHACQGRANERGLAGPEREAFLARCNFSRLTYRVERQQCRQQAAAKGIERAGLRDFLRECVRERTRQKE